MKKNEISTIVIEAVVGMAVSCIVERAINAMKERKKKEDPENTLVSDLTVKEFRELFVMEWRRNHA